MRLQHWFNLITFNLKNLYYYADDIMWNNGTFLDVVVDDGFKMSLEKKLVTIGFWMIVIKWCLV